MAGFFDFQNPIVIDTRNITAPSHAVNAEYVENAISGKVKTPVEVVSTVDISGTYTPATLTFQFATLGNTIINGISLSINDRLLLVNQADARQNGIYIVTTLGSSTVRTILTRANDFNASDKIFTGVSINVNRGTYAGTTWQLITQGTIILDSTALEWEQRIVAVGTSKFVDTITGNGIDTDFELTHNLNTTDISVTCRNTVTGSQVFINNAPVSGNKVKITFGMPPTTSQIFKIIVIG